MIDGMIIVLLVAFIVSNAAWMLYSQRLINKLMSRNYHEYVTTRIQEASAKTSAIGKEKPQTESFMHPKEDLKILTSQILR